MESISRRVARQHASCSSSLLAPERDWSAYRGTVAVNDLVELNLIVQSFKAEEETEEEPDPRFARLLDAGRPPAERRLPPSGRQQHLSGSLCVPVRMRVWQASAEAGQELLEVGGPFDGRR